MQRSLQAFGALTRNPTILWRLTEREVASRYRGSLLGWGWTLLNPLLMLAVYRQSRATAIHSHYQSGRFSEATLDALLHGIRPNDADGTMSASAWLRSAVQP